MARWVALAPVITTWEGSARKVIFSSFSPQTQFTQLVTICFIILWSDRELIVLLFPARLTSTSTECEEPDPLPHSSCGSRFLELPFGHIFWLSAWFISLEKECSTRVSYFPTLYKSFEAGILEVLFIFDHCVLAVYLVFETLLLLYSSIPWLHSHCAASITYID